MPRTSKKQATKENNPVLIYEKLELSKRIACYNFWCYLNTEGQEGWDPIHTLASIWNWRSSNYLQLNIREKSWPRIGRAMASLALDLQRRGIRLVDPHKKQKQDLRAQESDTETVASKTQLEYSEYSEESISQEERKMPPSILKKKKTTSFAGISPSKLNQQAANLSLDGAGSL